MIEVALALHKPDSNDSIDAAQGRRFGYRGSVRSVSGAAAQRIPVVLDGVISCAAALSRQCDCVRSLCILWSQRTDRTNRRAFCCSMHSGKRPFLTAGMHLRGGIGAAAGVAL